MCLLCLTEPLCQVYTSSSVKSTKDGQVTVDYSKANCWKDGKKVPVENCQNGNGDYYSSD